MKRTVVTTVLTIVAAGIAHQLIAQVAKSGSPAQGITRFTVRIENVSTQSTLKLSSGGAMAIPLSPAVWAVHTARNPILIPGEVERGLGLKGLAEAGMAERFAANLGGVQGIVRHGVSKEPVATAKASAPASPLLEPGYHIEFTFEARPGDRFSFALMLGPSNDGLIATGADGIALFGMSGQPASGNVTAQVSLWDAGTEMNEEPGLGPNQGLRQTAPHAGDPERRPVRPMSQAEFGQLWPPVSQIVRVTLQPVKRQ
jgi:hypothetical protein